MCNQIKKSKEESLPKQYIYITEQKSNNNKNKNSTYHFFISYS